MSDSKNVSKAEMPPYEQIVSIKVERIAGASRVRHPRLRDKWLYFSPGPKRIVDELTDSIEYGPAVIRVNDPNWFEVFNERRGEYKILDVEVRALDATSSAFELATASGIDLAAVKGTGSYGRILKSDVEAVIEETSPPATMGQPQDTPVLSTPEVSMLETPEQSTSDE